MSKIFSEEQLKNPVTGFTRAVTYRTLLEAGLIKEEDIPSDILDYQLEEKDCA